MTRDAGVCGCVARGIFAEQIAQMFEVSQTQSRIQKRARRTFDGTFSSSGRKSTFTFLKCKNLIEFFAIPAARTRMTGWNPVLEFRNFSVGEKALYMLASIIGKLDCWRNPNACFTRLDNSQKHYENKNLFVQVLLQF